MKPILFNTEMVQAILEGRKTTTRRIIKDTKCYQGMLEKRKISPNEFLDSEYCKNNWDDNTKILQNFRMPYYFGEVLYVRETWCRDEITPEDIYYKANYSEKDIKELFDDIKWKPSIHMPKEAARIFLRVKDIRVEMLQDMEFKDFISEGIEIDNDKKVLYESGIDVEKTRGLDEEVELFADLWDSTLKKDQIKQYGWNANPWVWVISFERCEKPNE